MHLSTSKHMSSSTILVRRGTCRNPRACHHPSTQKLSKPARGQDFRLAALDPSVILDVSDAQMMQAQITAAVLGAGVASFVATFAVLPRFTAALAEPATWRQDIYPALVQSKLSSITPAEAAAKAKRGAVLLDVRLSSSHAQERPEGSIGVPLYLPIQKWDWLSNIRRAGFAFFGIFGTEFNPEFAAQVARQIPQGQEVVVMCDTGGSLVEKVGVPVGFQSRSLKAVYYLQQAGLSKVYHMQGGVQEWMRAGLSTVSDTQPQQQQQPQQ